MGPAMTPPMTAPTAASVTLRLVFLDFIPGFGFIGAHVFDVLAYQPGRLSEDPLLIFKLWQGISSYGGFIGGVFGFAVYIKKHHLPVGPLDFLDRGDLGFPAVRPAALRHSP